MFVARFCALVRKKKLKQNAVTPSPSSSVISPSSSDLLTKSSTELHIKRTINRLRNMTRNAKYHGDHGNGQTLDRRHPGSRACTHVDAMTDELMGMYEIIMKIN